MGVGEAEARGTRHIITLTSRRPSMSDEQPSELDSIIHLSSDHMGSDPAARFLPFRDVYFRLFSP